MSLLSLGLHYRPPVVSRFVKLNSHISWPLFNAPAINISPKAIFIANNAAQINKVINEFQFHRYLG